jgi:hypothetical protein
MFFIICPSYQEATRVVAMIVVLATALAIVLLVVVEAEEEMVKIYTGSKQ